MLIAVQIFFFFPQVILRCLNMIDFTFFFFFSIIFLLLWKRFTLFIFIQNTKTYCVLIYYYVLLSVLVIH